MTKRLFISKNSTDTNNLSAFLSPQNTALISHSFLQFEGLNFKIDTNYDVIFFTSPRSVLFFKATLDIPRHVKIACTGSKTAELLEKMGYKVEFKGEQSGDIHHVADAFKIWAKNRTVLFPMSDISLRTVSSQLDSDSVVEVVVYKTIIKGFKIAPCDIYIFTSPSNVAGFLMENEVPTQAKIIAWGASTQEALTQKGFKVNYTLKESSIESLIEYWLEISLI
ncbi:MAG: uroporphyrinogen-III synthase [Crocinitomicaceae bacterium]|nr:uroporphyrinogen-III synthase [Crocinitomicaceae bacterium]